MSQLFKKTFEKIWKTNDYFKQEKCIVAYKLQ